MEGTEVATGAFEGLVVAMAVAILVGLFAVQKRGTAAIGRLFGSVMVLWFCSLAALGAVQIADQPAIFRAINPVYGADLFVHNWVLTVACIALVVGFRSSTTLAAAYGVAIAATMLITTVLLYVALRERFRWSTVSAGALCSGLLAAETCFFAASLFKIPVGGWFPLAVGAVAFVVLTTWRTGRRLVGERIRGGGVPIAAFLANLDLGHGVHQVVLHYGFMEAPDVPRGLGQGLANRLAVHADTVAYFLGAEFLVVTDRPGMVRWRERLFSRLSRNAGSAADYFSLPADCTVTIGERVEL